jgi:glycosyltransferase involved in cell wall biosynthesis
VQLLGNLNEAALAARYEEAAVFTSASLYEPFGLSVLEAAQAGCALVLSDIATFRELWEGAALFFRSRDAQSLAEACSVILGDDKACVRWGEAARLRARTFSLKRMAAETWDVHRLAVIQKAA